LETSVLICSIGYVENVPVVLAYIAVVVFCRKVAITMCAETEQLQRVMWQNQSYILHRPPKRNNKNIILSVCCNASFSGFTYLKTVMCHYVLSVELTAKGEGKSLHWTPRFHVISKKLENMTGNVLFLTSKCFI
jgi:hypothetical protein